MNLTNEQIECVKRGQAVRLTPQEVGEDVVLLKAATFQALCDHVEEAADQALQKAWQKATQRGTTELLKDEN